MPEGQGKISSLQVLVAHMWRSIIRCRFDANSMTDETTMFDIPMAEAESASPRRVLRKRSFFTECGTRCPGGAGKRSWVDGLAGEQNGGGDKVRELYCEWVKKPNFNEFNAPPKNFYILINSPRFNIYENDLGWGKPVAARSGEANIFDGRITIFRRMEEGSVEIGACLSLETLSALAEDAEFMQYVV